MQCQYTHNFILQSAKFFLACLLGLFTIMRVRFHSFYLSSDGRVSRCWDLARKWEESLTVEISINIAHALVQSPFGFFFHFSLFIDLYLAPHTLKLKSIYIEREWSGFLNTEANFPHTIRTYTPLHDEAEVWAGLEESVLFNLRRRWWVSNFPRDPAASLPSLLSAKPTRDKENLWGGTLTRLSLYTLKCTERIPTHCNLAHQIVCQYF